MLSPLFHSTASYIDPGTGSMLFTLFIGLLTTGYFFLKKVLIKLKFLFTAGGAAKSNGKGKLPYVIFSDHKRYWNVFKPICDEFERRGVELHYWTASSDDPALEAEYEHVACEFIGEGNKAFARLNMMDVGIVLSTTPGLDVLQWKRSKDADYYVHTLHAVGSAAGYRMFGLDYYDAVLLSGQFQIDEIRELEQLRGLPPKDLEIVGCTYLDVMAERLKELDWLDSHGNVVLAGPPGLGKTMIALGLGLLAVDSGYTVAFEKMESFIEILDRADVDRKAGFRLRYLRKCQLVIVDEIGYTPFTKQQANRFFSFVSDAYERTSMVFTTNKEITQWEELMGDQVLVTAMLDRILHHARCFSLRGESYRLKHPELYAAE